MQVFTYVETKCFFVFIKKTDSDASNHFLLNDVRVSPERHSDVICSINYAFFKVLFVNLKYFIKKHSFICRVFFTRPSELWQAHR